jgi:acyl-CoA thioesterase
VTELTDGTAVTRTGEGTYAAAVSPDWWVFTGPNGGYVAALVLRALTHAVGDPERAARSLTVHYLRPAANGPATVATRVLRSGRTLTTVAADLVQDGRTVATALAAFATPRAGAPAFHDARPPYAVPWADVPESRWPPELMPPIARRFAYRPVTEERMFTGGPRAEAAAWVRFVDGDAYDPVALTVVSDALVPAVFAKATAPLAATTVDLTVHFRLPAGEPPPAGWCQASFTTTVAADGYAEEDGAMYDESGQLVAQSRQLAVLLPAG